VLQQALVGLQERGRRLIHVGYTQKHANLSVFLSYLEYEIPSDSRACTSWAASCPVSGNTRMCLSGERGRRCPRRNLSSRLLEDSPKI
jgi:hypothetical protein